MLRRYGPVMDRGGSLKGTCNLLTYKWCQKIKTELLQSNLMSVASLMATATHFFLTFSITNNKIQYIVNKMTRNDH